MSNKQNGSGSRNNENQYAQPPKSYGFSIQQPLITPNSNNYGAPPVPIGNYGPPHQQANSHNSIIRTNFFRENRGGRPPQTIQNAPSIMNSQSIQHYNPPPMQLNNQRGQQQQSQHNQIQRVQQEAIYQSPKLQNLVSTANLQCDLDLKDIAFRCRNAEFNPKRFAAVIMRMKEPTRTTALIFKTGKMVITGAKSEQHSKDAAKCYAKAIQKVGNPKVKLADFKVQNMVGSCSVDFRIQLEKLFHSPHHNYCDFNPDTFPGLIYHMSNPKVCLLIFSSGKIVLTGAKQRSDIDRAFKEIIPTLKKFVKTEFKDRKEDSNSKSTRMRN